MIVGSIKQHFQRMVDVLTQEAFEFAEAGDSDNAAAALNDAAIYRSVVDYIAEQQTTIDIVFAKADDTDYVLEFVEVEDAAGRSISAGKWLQREDGFQALHIDVLAQQVSSLFEAPPESVMDQLRAVRAAGAVSPVDPPPTCSEGVVPLTDEELEAERLVNEARVSRMVTRPNGCTDVIVGRWPRRKVIPGEVVVSAHRKRQAGA